MATLHAWQGLNTAAAAPILLDPRDPMEAARQFVAAHGTTRDGVRALWRHRGTFWAWTGSYFEMSKDETLRAQVWTFLDGALRLLKDGTPGPFKPSRSNVGEVVDALTAVCQLDEHLDPPAWLDRTDLPPATEFSAFANGLLHLPTRKLHAPTPAYFNIIASTVTYDPNAAPPQLWFEFLTQLFGNDYESAILLQDWFGYVLSPDTSQEKILAMIGPTRCGKGTISRLLTKLLGPNSVAGPSMKSLGEPFGIEPLITKSLAALSDVRIGKHTDKSTVLERLLSISGEDRMTVGCKNKQAWNGRLPTRIMMLTNEMPALPDSSGALPGRFVILVFTVSFYGREDRQLTDKLASEASGILNWSLDGYARLNKRGYFVQPRASAKVAEAIELLASPIRAFINECCEVGPQHSAGIDEMYRAWTHWRSTEGHSKVSDTGKQWFGRNLNAVIPGLTVVRVNDVRTYQGIRLLPGIDKGLTRSLEVVAEVLEILTERHKDKPFIFRDTNLRESITLALYTSFSGRLDWRIEKQSVMNTFAKAQGFYIHSKEIRQHEDLKFHWITSVPWLAEASIPDNAEPDTTIQVMHDGVPVDVAVEDARSIAKGFREHEPV